MHIIFIRVKINYHDFLSVQFNTNSMLSVSMCRLSVVFTVSQ